MSSSLAAAIAIGSAAVAVLALVLAAVATARLRRVRSAQAALVDTGSRDLVDFTVSLQGRIDSLHRALDDVSASLSHLGHRVDGTISRTAIVRYDAYANTGGHQSASVALLDASRSGVVLSAIQGRDYARIYIKELEEGRAAISLSPEEEEAVDRAMRSQAK